MFLFLTMMSFFKVFSSSHFPFTGTSPSDIYTLSLHDALPICQPGDTRPDHDDVTPDGHPGRLSIGPAPERRLTVITVSGISTTIARTARAGKLLATSNGPAAKAAVAPQKIGRAHD